MSSDQRSDNVSPSTGNSVNITAKKGQNGFRHRKVGEAGSRAADTAVGDSDLNIVVLHALRLKIDHYWREDSVFGDRQNRF